MRRLGLAPVGFALGVFGIWESAVHAFSVPAYLLPAPSAIFAAVDRSLALHLMVTFSESLAGFVLASAVAFCGAIAFVRSAALERGLFPIAIAVKTTPLAAIAPLPVLWLGTCWWSKVAAAALISFFPVLVNTVRGLKAADQESLAVVGAIFGEFVGATQGLGYLIMVASAHLETDILFSAIFASALAGIAMVQAIDFFEKRAVFWQKIEAE